MTHDLWASLNTKMIEYLNSISLKKLVDDQLAKGVSVEEHPVKRAISTQPVVKPIKHHRTEFGVRPGHRVLEVSKVESARYRPMDMTPHFPIYMDYGATNPVDQRVVDAMIPWLREHFGNPASRSHAWGWEAEAAVEKRACRSRR
jgi:hypothetical protein